jgi:hypothetical protein
MCLGVDAAEPELTRTRVLIFGDTSRTHLPRRPSAHDHHIELPHLSHDHSSSFCRGNALSARRAETWAIASVR